MSQNWREEINAADYFGHQKKKQEIENRRPVIRRASDLVGPGIGASAVRITDFNDILATYNGYYSARAGAYSAPNTLSTVLVSGLAGGYDAVALATEPLRARVSAGQTIVVTAGSQSQTFVASVDALIGDTSITISPSFVPVTILPGATATSSGTFVGFSVMDDEVGGTQTFTDMGSGIEYKRLFLRNPSAPDSVSFGLWKSSEVTIEQIDIAVAGATYITQFAVGESNYLKPPALTTRGDPGTYLRVDPSAIYVTKPGIYTGFITVTNPNNAVVNNLAVNWPLDAYTHSIETPHYFASGARIPFTFWTYAVSASGPISVSLTSLSKQSYRWSDFAITRIGDAPLT